MGILDNFNKTMENMLKGSAEIEQLFLKDEVAAKTEWKPIKRGGTNFCTHSLREVSPDRVEFKTNTLALLQPAAFIIVGAGVFIYANANKDTQDDVVFYVLTVAAASIIFFAASKIYRWTTPKVFDRKLGVYWKSRKQPCPENKQNNNSSCRIDDIHAIQLLKKTGGSSRNSSSYISYEFNLVLKDSSRMNVVDHGKLPQHRVDAEKLSKFLDIPVWDASFATSKQVEQFNKD